MNHATTCQFCKKPLVLRVSDDYAELGDPMNLIKLASCNPCADLRVKARKEEEAIAKGCYRLIEVRQKKDSGAVQSQIRLLLDSVTRKYADTIARINRSDTAIWDMAFPELLFDRPERFGKILSKYRQDCQAAY